MLKLLTTLIIFAVTLFAIDIVEHPIPFGEKRKSLTRDYIWSHYGIETQEIAITPRIILIHYTAFDDLEESLRRFTSETLPTDRSDIANASALNVSTHFMIDRDGTIYRLMDETTMGRHVIGLNYSSIGIENVGGESSPDNLTTEQLRSNIELVRYLKEKYATISYLVGHHEYRCFEGHPLWLERDAGYRTEKPDPGAHFMRRLRHHFPDLKPAPCDALHD